MSAIERYLDELRRELWARRVPRRDRILAEVADHLRSAEPECGDRAAVACFGTARELAERFADDAAARSGLAASFASVAGFLVALALVGSISISLRRYAWLDGPSAPVFVVPTFGVQVAFVAALVSLARALLLRRGRAVSHRLVARGSAVAAGALVCSTGSLGGIELAHLAELGRGLSLGS